MMNLSQITDKEDSIKKRIEEVKKRFPYHSTQPYLIQELEALEEELEKARAEKNTLKTK